MSDEIERRLDLICQIVGFAVSVDQLSISETTVNFHIKNILDKLRANDRAHAVTIAVRRGLLEI